MISAYESIDLVDQCILSGADAYLLKPLRMHELRNIWQYVWRRRHEAVLQQHVSEELMSARRAAERKEPALEKATKLRGERQRLYTTDYPELALAARQLDRLEITSTQQAERAMRTELREAVADGRLGGTSGRPSCESGLILANCWQMFGKLSLVKTLLLKC